MKKNFSLQPLPLLIAFAVLLITLFGFQTSPVTPTTTAKDTLPDRSKKIRNIDEAIKEVDQADDELDLKKYYQDFQKIETGIEKTLQDIHVNEAEIKKQLAAAMKQIDAAKIQASIEKAFKEIDLKQIQASVHQSLNNLEMEKIKLKIDQALNKVDLNQIKADVNASIAKINWDKIKDQLEEVKDIDRLKIEKELQNIRPEIEKSLKAAHLDLERTKRELQVYKTLIGTLRKDGLIQQDHFKIQFAQGALYINDQKQSKEILSKYASILNGLKDFTIISDENHFDIQN